jgi:hypothetical protein
MPEKYYPLKGGLNLSASPLEVFPGNIFDSLNYFESTLGGYERIAGNEKFDGKLAPSEDYYWVARFDSWDTKVTDISAGDDITVDGTLSMHVLAVDDSAETDTLIAHVCQLTGDIPGDLDTTPLDWDGVSSLVSITPRDSEDDDEDEFYLEAAWDYTRSQIDPVPGDGDSVGIIQIDDTVVAFRNDGTTPKLYYSSASGWVEGKIGRVAEITSYTADSILPGETIDGGDFEVAAVCEWLDDDLVPDNTKAWLVLIPLDTATAPATGANTASGGASFTIASVIQPIDSFGDGWEYQNYNFLSHPEALASWIADGKNVLMSYSAEHKCLLPISPDFNHLSGQKATEVRVQDDMLMYATGEGTFNISEPGLPFNFSGVYGASNIGVGDFITGMSEADSDALIVFTQRGAKKLYGSSADDWQFKHAASNVGAEPHGTQKIDDIFTFSKRGITSLLRSEREGGYTGGAISTHIQKLMKTLGTSMTCSTAITSKEQVRWYFTNKTWLMMTRVPTEEGYSYSFTQGYDPNKVVRQVSTEVWSDGAERTFFTSDDGYVYESEKGTNFDGEPIYSFLRLHSNHLGTPGRDKSFKRIFFESRSENEAVLTLTFEINYGEKTFDAKDITVVGGDSVYDDDDVYDSARYDNVDRTRSKATLKGRGFTIAFVLDNESKFTSPFRLTGYTVVYENLGRARK